MMKAVRQKREAFGPVGLSIQLTGLSRPGGLQKQKIRYGKSSEKPYFWLASKRFWQTIWWLTQS